MALTSTERVVFKVLWSCVVKCIRKTMVDLIDPCLELG